MASVEQQKVSKVPYCCDFCRNQLVPVEFGFSDYVRAIFLLRPFQCPHCFNCVVRPISLIGRLPLIGLLFRGRSNGAASRSGVLPHRDGDVNGPVVRMVANFGRWVQRCEKTIARFFMAVFGALWAVVWFLPGLLFRKKRKRSRSRFLKSL